MTVDRRVSVVAPAVTSVPIPVPAGSGVGCRLVYYDPSAQTGPFSMPIFLAEPHPRFPISSAIAATGTWYRAVPNFVCWTTPFLELLPAPRGGALDQIGYLGVKTLIPGVFFYQVVFHIGYSRLWADPWPWSSRPGPGWTVSAEAVPTNGFGWGDVSYAVTDGWGDGSASCEVSGFVTLAAGNTLMVNTLCDFPGNIVGSSVDIFLVSA